MSRSIVNTEPELLSAKCDYQQSLETQLQKRLQNARRGNFSEQSVTDIFEQAIAEHDKR